VLDPASGDLRCANGGHPGALVVAPDGSLREVGAVGVMLGVLPDLDFVCEETRLLPGERLFVFSDGVYEILDPRGAMLPLETFHRRLRHASASDPSPVASMLHFASATRGGPLEDDFTMLSVELVGA
jgi:sigma-B regulation protein RsbU (phosphoserine phosphatase)